MIGLRFNRWQIVAAASKASNYQRRWLCMCECGITKMVQERHLISGASKSCGCLARWITKLTHTTHGMCNSPSYLSWLSMRRRCEDRQNNRYHLYGGRGISVCGRWLHFENFLSDMGERPAGLSLDRIDNDGNYCAENCRWADAITQANNGRRNKLLTLNGRTQSCSLWAREYGIKPSVVFKRLRRGDNIERALR